MGGFERSKGGLGGLLNFHKPYFGIMFEGGS